MDKARLERELSKLDGFAEPAVELEQYPTPDWLAAHLVHLADTQGDIAGRTVLDLGAGTGVLALAASTREPARVLALERDPSALAVARENERRFDASGPVEWLLGDTTRLPLRVTGPVTVLTNPPFGAQQSNVHADRRFLEAIAALAEGTRTSTATESLARTESPARTESEDSPSVVSYSIHNAGSQSFLESFATDNDATVTHAFEAAFELDRQFEFQRESEKTITVEVVRIEWR